MGEPAWNMTPDCRRAPVKNRLPKCRHLDEKSNDAERLPRAATAGAVSRRPHLSPLT
jgi:hypothetical protein